MIDNPMTMYYCSKLDRWCVDTGDTPYWFSCGEGFELCVGRLKVPCRIEFGKCWYIIMKDTAFALLEGRKYVVILN
jgi:hypothetical protein